jgi:cell division protein FtsW
MTGSDAMPADLGGLGESAGISADGKAARTARLPWAYYTIWVVSLALLALGLVMVYSASTAHGFFSPAGIDLTYVKQQAVAAAGGLFLLIVLSRVDYRKLRSLALVGLAAAIVLLLAVHVPNVGRGAKGAVRWIDFGPLSVQPSEVAKLAIVLVSAHLLCTKRALTKSFRGMAMPLLPVAAVVCLLIVMEPDLGTAIVVAAIVMGLLWIADMRLSHWFGLSAAAAAVATVFVLSAPYRRARLFSFLNPAAASGATRFQITQALIALASGGLLGVGPGNSVQKFSYLPEAHTDMIYAIIGEELGLLGAGVVIGLFALFGVAAWHLARRCADPFGRYLVAGFALLVTSQAIINIGGVMGFLPITGIPLPFVSFGRTNLMVVLAGVGVMLSVARYGPAASAKRSPAFEDYERGSASESAGALSGELTNVTYLDRRRRDGGARRARSRYS